LKSRSLVLLSGEGTTLPEAEARALFLAYDSGSKFSLPEKKLLLVESAADPFVIARRIAFARRVGVLLGDISEVRTLKGKIRLRNYDLGARQELDPERYLRGLDLEVDLVNPDYELTLVRGKEDYLALTVPQGMRQGWSLRRPRVRPYFHPSAIFPKLARALVNLSRCKEGDVFLDPFCGTGSLPLEAAIIGTQVVALDRNQKMTLGSMANMKHFGQSWLGVIRCESLRPPLNSIDAIATDVPYGRASSTMGTARGQVLKAALATFPALVRRGARMVVMHSHEDLIEGSGGLAVEEEHDLQVHKKLTRTITVLRRK
jgi:tRNA (guanine10-N2)-dimethyltransferase